MIDIKNQLRINQKSKNLMERILTNKIYSTKMDSS